MSDNQPPGERPLTLTPEQAFALVGCGRTAGYDALRNGTFPVQPIKVGVRWYVPAVPLLNWLGVEGQAP